MKALISTIKGLFDAIMIPFKILKAGITALLNLIKYLGQAMSIAFSFISTFPEWLQTFAIITISISILYMVLGRKGGSD